MLSITQIILSLFFITCVLSQSTNSSVRVTNGVNDNLTFNFSSSIATSTFTLGLGQSSAYFPCPDGFGHINTIVNSNGTALTNVSILVTANGPVTAAAAYDKNGTFKVFGFNDSFPAYSLTGGSNYSYIRLIDLSTTPTTVALVTAAGILFDYIGFLQQTTYVAVNPATTTTVNVTTSGTTNVAASFNSTSALANTTAYTVFFLGSDTNVPSIALTFDQLLPSNSFVQVTTSVMNITSGRPTTGNFSATTAKSITSGSMSMTMVMSTGPVVTSANGATTAQQTSDAGINAISLILAFVVFILSF